MLSNQANAFLKFLEGKAKVTGKFSFNDFEYAHINGHDASIEELVNAGRIRVAGDIAGTIELLPDYTKGL